MPNYIRLFRNGSEQPDGRSGDGEASLMVSICAVCYNHAPYLRQALNSFLAQKRKYTDPLTGEERTFGIEILIHDDASTDGSGDIIREYEKKYPEEVKPILQTENQYSQGITNISGAFNFPRAQGKYITLMDCDDYWQDHEKLSVQVSYMEAHPACQLCVHAAEVRNDNGELVDKNLMRPYKGDRDLSAEELIDKAGSFPFGSMMLRRSLVKELPEYYVNCPVGDRPLELMAAAAYAPVSVERKDAEDRTPGSGEGAEDASGRAGTSSGSGSAETDCGFGDAGPAAHYIDRPMSVYRFNGAGSWTSSMKSDDPEEYREKQDTYARQMKAMYEGFDEETGGRFHKECVSAANRLYFLTRVNLREFHKIFDPRWKKFYRELPARERFFIRFEKTLPGAYRWAQEKYRGKRK